MRLSRVVSQVVAATRPCASTKEGARTNPAALLQHIASALAQLHPFGCCDDMLSECMLPDLIRAVV